MVTVARRSKPEPAKSSFTVPLEKVKAFVAARTAEAANKKDKERLRDELYALVERHGYVGGDGHTYLDLPEKVAGFGALQLRRTAKDRLDTDIARRILAERGCLDECERETYHFIQTDEARSILFAAIKSAGIWDQVIETVTELDDDKITAYHAEHRDVLTEKDIDAMFVTDESWAFWTVDQAGVE